jgi:hypothetical protein
LVVGDRIQSNTRYRLYYAGFVNLPCADNTLSVVQSVFDTIIAGIKLRSGIVVLRTIACNLWPLFFVFDDLKMLPAGG